MTNIKFSDYSINHLETFLEKKLFLKLSKIGIKTIGDFENLTLEEFSSHKGVGVNAINLFVDFKKYFSINKSSILKEIKKNTEFRILPNDEYKDIEEKINFLQELSITVLKFCDLVINKKYAKIFSEYYGLEANKYSNEDIALLNNLSNERVRQIRVKTLKQFTQFVHLGIDSKNRLKLNEDIINKLNKIKLKFDNIECFVFDEFKNYVSKEFQISTIDDFNNELKFLIDLLNYSFFGKLESQSTEAVLISTNLKTKKKYNSITEHTVNVLKKTCIKLSENDLLIKLKKKIGKFENQKILRFIKSLPEINFIVVDDHNFYEIKFHLLSRASDKAFRVLYNNNNKEMYIDDIVSKINLLQIEHKFKAYDRHSLALHSDKRFKPFGKTGKWILSESNKSTEIIEVLIKKALTKLNKPSTIDEIILKVEEERKNVNIKSIQILLSKICFKTELKLYILKEWKNKYKDLKLVEKRKKHSRKTPPVHRTNQINHVLTYLENKYENKDYASIIIKALTSKDNKYTTQSFYKIFENENYFEKIKEGNSLIVRSKQSVKEPVEENVLELITSGESSTCEFKETMRVCLSQKAPPQVIERGVLKTIAAFLNSKGGDLFIGVNDSEEIVGLEKDYLSFNKPQDQNKDGFLKHLDNIIGKTFSNSIHSSLRIGIETINNLDFCRINVKKVKTPIFAIIDKKEIFYIRRSGSTVELSKSEMMKYLKNRN